MKHVLDEDAIFDALEQASNYLSLTAIYLNTSLAELDKRIEEMGVRRHLDRAIARRKKSPPPPEGSDLRHKYLCDVIKCSYELCGRNKTRLSQYLGVSVRCVREWFRCGHVFTPPPRFGVSRGSILWAIEKELIEDIVTRCHGNRSRASRVLGISVRSLRLKLIEYQVISGWKTTL